MSAIVKALDIELLDRRPDAREVDEDKVRAIAISMVDVGQLQPIRVRPKDGGRFEVTLGVHRVEACRSLGLAEVDGIITDEGEIFAELAMIDENLCRSDLGPSDRARQTARRKAIYEELHPETAQGAVGRGGYENSRQVGDHSEPPVRFTADTAAATGSSERTVQRDAERGEKISPDVLELVRGTELDTGTYLDGLKRFSPDQQRMLVERDLEALSRRDVNGARSIAARRQEPADSLDYFPTPPWATRALLEKVLRQGLNIDLDHHLVWDPACGEGHITGVVEEYGAIPFGSDIFDYSVDGRAPPGWAWAKDFLAEDLEGGAADWIIMNPPFGDKALAFVLKALRLARRGVAVFVRQQWLEGVTRYTELFSKTPPTLIAQFAERVPLAKGRWDPEGDTLTSYVWLVWKKPLSQLMDWPSTPPEFVWIPPGQREALTRQDDVERFTAHPVLSVQTYASASVLPGASGDEAGASALLPAAEVSSTTSAEPMPPAMPAEHPPGEKPGNADAAPSGRGTAEPAGGVAGLGTSPVLTSSEINDRIKAAYAVDPVDYVALEAATGLGYQALKKRASRLDLTSFDRQRAAARRAVENLNINREGADA